MNKKINDLITKNLKEDDGTDPLTLTNTILAHNMKKTGFDWVKQVSRQTTVDRIFYDAKKEADNEGEYKLEEAVREQQPMPVETNDKDPNIQSTDPQFNSCPAYLNGVCRVNGKPCVYSNADYKECGVYNLAKTGMPVLFEIPFGKENDMAYIKGIKDK